MNWEGKIVACFDRIKGLRDEPVYLIEVDDGDRIWRYESELDWAPGHHEPTSPHIRAISSSVSCFLGNFIRFWHTSTQARH